MNHLSSIPACYEGFLQRNPNINSTSQEEYMYFADFNKKWSFYCSHNGAMSLLGMFQKNETPIANLQAQIDASPSPSLLEKEGQEIYSRKPNKISNSVTWSQEEFQHIGFLKQYLQLKSIQRFAEAYSQYDRAYNLGCFQHYQDREKSTPADMTPKTIRIVSLGGGPAYELVAFRLFMKEICPRTPVELISLDLEASWAPICASLDVKFAVWDFLEDKRSMQDVLRDMYIQNAKLSDNVAECDIQVPFSALHVDFCMTSYVFHHYILTDTQRTKLCNILSVDPFQSIPQAILDSGFETSEFLARGFSPFYNAQTPALGFSETDQPQPPTLLCQDIDSSSSLQLSDLDAPFSLFIMDRAELMPSLTKIEFQFKDQLKVIRVISQSKSRDDRQALILRRGISSFSSLYKTPLERDITFPNQPYEEHKDKSRHKYIQKMKHSQKATQGYQKHKPKSGSSDSTYDSIYGANTNNGGRRERTDRSYDHRNSTRSDSSDRQRDY